MTEKIQNAILIGAIIAHFLLVGADAFAQAAITPMALSAPPASLAMYQGDYVYDSDTFWRISNAVALGLLILAVAAHWRTRRRNLLLVTLAGSIVISVISLGYIFPEYTALVSSAYSDAIDPALIERGANWRALALTRLLVFGGLGVLPLWALTRPVS